MNFHFCKYHGAGNDFILLDNRPGIYNHMKNKDSVAALCHRRFGIGADGLMMIENSDGYDFKMVYYNADGNEGSMCGNGGRCIVAFAHRLGIIEYKTKFIASDGEHEAELMGSEYVNLKMQDVHQVDMYNDHVVLNTGSPHYILPISQIDTYPVYEKGKHIRYSEEFPKGINVNFIEKSNSEWKIRTYERGVEDETWACGTGATAAALAIVEMNKSYDLNEIKLIAKGGPLTIRFERKAPGHFENIWLCGCAVFVYEGEFTIE